MKNKKSFSILIFSWRGPGHPHAGGAEIVTHEHAKAWVKSGHQVTLFTSGYEGGSDTEIIDGVKIVRRGSQILSVQLKALIWYLFDQSNQYDLVIDQFHGLPFFTPLFVRCKKMVFIHEVTKEVWKYNPLPQPYQTIVAWLGQTGEPLLFKYLYKNIPFMTVSESTKIELKEYGIPDSGITIIHNGFHPLKTVVKSKKNILTFIGALAKDKGIEDAIRVFALMKKMNFSFWVIGKHDDQYYKKIQELVRQYKLIKHIKFWGYVSEYKKYQLLSQSYLIVNPSVREGWGLTVIEAASVKTPTVAYKVSGLMDAIIDNETGVLVENKTPQSIYQSIVSLVKDKKRYRKLQIGAYNWSGHFSWKNSTQKSLRLIQKIME